MNHRRIENNRRLHALCIRLHVCVNFWWRVAVKLGKNITQAGRHATPPAKAALPRRYTDATRSTPAVMRDSSAFLTKPCTRIHASAVASELALHLFTVRLRHDGRDLQGLPHSWWTVCELVVGHCSFGAPAHSSAAAPARPRGAASTAQSTAAGRKCPRQKRVQGTARLAPAEIRCLGISFSLCIRFKS